MSEYRVRAVRWAHGWELHIDDERVTQSHTLADAERMVRDYLEADGAPDAATSTIHIAHEVPSAPGVTDLALDARRKISAAAMAQREAAACSRHAARSLKEAGLSGNDIAKIMGVSKGRVSQLVNS